MTRRRRGKRERAARKRHRRSVSHIFSSDHQAGGVERTDVSDPVTLKLGAKKRAKSCVSFLRWTRPNPSKSKRCD